MRKLLFAVDGTQRGLETVSILGRLLKNQEDVKVVLIHCLQQTATLLPEDMCLDVEENCRIPSEEQDRVAKAVVAASSKRLIDAGFLEPNIEVRLKLECVDPALGIIDEGTAEEIPTTVVGRRGRSRAEMLLIGSVSGKVAHYGRGKAVWVVDVPVNESGKVLIAMEGVPEDRKLVSYAAEMFGPCPGLSYTLVHVMPPIPPGFWDDGHILNPSEQEARQSRIDKWRNDWAEMVGRYMSDARELLLKRGIGERNIKNWIIPSKAGITGDLLTEIESHEFQIVVMGKTSLHEERDYLIGSHSSRILHHTRGIILCLVS